jgi:hypothetical protein
VGTTVEAGARRRCRGAVVLGWWAGEGEGRGGLGGCGQVWRGAHGGGHGERRTTRADGEAAGARRVTESERRGRRKEKARGPFISPLCRVPTIWHSAKIFFNFIICFVECQITGTRQRQLCRVSVDRYSARSVLGSLPSVNRLTLSKAIFTECHL